MSAPDPPPPHESDDQWMPLPDISLPPPTPTPNPPSGQAAGSAGPSVFAAPPIDLGAPIPSSPTPGSASLPTSPVPAPSGPSRSGGRRVVAAVGAGTLLAAAAITGGVVLASSGDDDDEGGSTDSGDVVVLSGGSFSVGESIEVELGNGGATATLFVAGGDGEVEITADPLEGQDVMLTYTSSDGSPAASCNSLDAESAGAVETCRLTVAADDSATVKVAPYDASSGYGVVRLEARSIAPAPTPPPTDPATEQTDPTDPEPESTDPPVPEPTGPLDAGVMSLGDEVEVELGDDGTFIALSGTSPDEGFEVFVSPFDGQDVMLSVVTEDGAPVDGCKADNGHKGDPETCQVAAGHDEPLWILVEPYDSDSVGGSVGILAQGTGSVAPESIDPSIVLAGLGVPGWEDKGHDAQSSMFLCNGTYPPDAYEGDTQVWRSADSGYYAYGSTLVFGSDAAAQDYMSTFAGEYYSGCTNAFSDGSTFVWDDLFVDDDGAINLDYSVYDGSGTFQYSGRERALAAGNVVVDVSCDGGGAECDDVFEASADRLFEVVG